MNRCREMTVTYTFGEQSEVLDSATICSWITGSAEGQIQLNMDQVNAYVQALAAKYNTAGTARAFHTATGRDVSVTGPFGWKIDQAGEAQALADVIRTAQSQSREPVYASKAVDRSAVVGQYLCGGRSLWSACIHDEGWSSSLGGTVRYRQCIQELHDTAGTLQSHLQAA